VLAKVPTHLAVIMDGNGRWAESRGLPRTEGHKAGAKRVEDLVQYCQEVGIKVLTLFAFSSENWKRPQKEIDLLMQLFERYLKKETQKMHQKNIQLKVIGDLMPLKGALRKRITEAESLTQLNSGLKIRLAVNYGGRAEIVLAAKKMAEMAISGKLNLENFSEQEFDKYTYFSDVPEPDLFIRTSGEQRISNFILWSLAYTELYFAPCSFPDFDKAEFLEALNWFSTRKRRFGATTHVPQAQVYNVFNKYFPSS
jgi:undecaprenyl diphosphate synthase